MSQKGKLQQKFEKVVDKKFKESVSDKIGGKGLQAKYRSEKQLCLSKTADLSRKMNITLDTTKKTQDSFVKKDVNSKSVKKNSKKVKKVMKK